MTAAAEHEILAPFSGTVIAVAHAPGDPVAAGAAVVVLEAMKMEHEVLAEVDGVLLQIGIAVGDTVQEGQRLAVLSGVDGDIDRVPGAPLSEQDGRREDLEAVRARHELGLDAGRPDAVAKRHQQGRRTARENVADLLDVGTFVEYGPLIFAAQERRRSKEDLIARTPADGLIAGVGDVDGDPIVAMSYDYTVLAGTQGMRNHLKKDRLFEIAERRRLPVSCSPKVAAAVPGTWIGRSSQGSIAGRFTCSRVSAGWCRL